MRIPGHIPGEAIALTAFEFSVPPMSREPGGPKSPTFSPGPRLQFATFSSKQELTVAIHTSSAP